MPNVTAGEMRDLWQDMVDELELIKAKDFATTAKQDLIIAELDAIKTKLNGTIDTELKGSNQFKIIRDFTVTPGSSSTNQTTGGSVRHAGNIFGSTVTYANIKDYKKVVILIKNDFDVEVGAIRVDLRLETIRHTRSSDRVLPAGGILLITPDQYANPDNIPQLLEFADEISIRTSTTNTPTSGTMRIIILGGEWL
jgi:hypothetical protein